MMPFITSSIKPTFPGGGRCQVGEFYLSLEPVCRRPSGTKSMAYAGRHRSKTTSKSVILGQRDDALRTLHSRTSVNPLGLQLDFGHLDCDVVTRPLIIKISKDSHRNDERPDKGRDMVTG